MRITKLFLILLLAIYSSNSFADEKANSKVKKESSGLDVWVMVKNLPPSPETSLAYYISDCEVEIRLAKDNRLIKKMRSDKDGYFKIALPPGKYILSPILQKGNNLWVAEEASTVVQRGFNEVTVCFDAGW